MKTLLVVGLLLCFGAGGCASMSRKECSTVDWRSVGYEDGVAGRSGDRIGAHRKACARHGIATDLHAYRTGRAEGLREYCQPQVAYRVGVNGGGYSGVCPTDLAPAFEAAYAAGRELYALHYRVDNATARLASTRMALHELELRMTSLAAVVVSRDSEPEARALALVESRQLAERHGQLQAEIAGLERDKRQYELELDDYLARVAVTR